MTKEDQILLAVQIGFIGLMLVGYVRVMRRQLFARIPRREPMWLEDYVGSAIQRLARWVGLAYLGWISFYVAWLCLPEMTWARNLCTNGTSLALLLFYYELSAVNRHGVQRARYLRTGLVGWLFIFAAATIYELLWVADGRATSGLEELPFMTLYGLGQAVALFLVVGRLDSTLIADHMRANEIKDGPRMFRWNRWFRCAGLFTGYTYAAIQPLYPMLDREEKLRWALVTSALVLKFCLIVWLCGLFRRRGAFLLSPLEHQVYEGVQFAVEGASSFERTFLRKHLNRLYRRRFVRRHIGYLGIEYSYLDAFNRMHMQLGDWRDGLFVEKVYRASDAWKKGVERGDFIIEIGGNPVGRQNRLSKILSEVPKDGSVELTLVRRTDTRSLPSAANRYEKMRIRVELEDYELLLRHERPVEGRVVVGGTLLSNAVSHGAVVRMRDGSEPIIVQGVRRIDMERAGYYLTPDARMLRVVLSWLVEGERVVLDYVNRPDDKVQRRLVLTARI